MKVSSEAELDLNPNAAARWRPVLFLFICLLMLATFDRQHVWFSTEL